MWRMASGVFLCLLILLQTAHSQPEAGPGMAGRDPAAAGALPAMPVELGAAHGAINRLNNPAEKIDLSTPEATVRSFIWAFNNGDLAQARRCVAQAAPIEELQPLQEMLGRQMGKYAVLSLKDLRTYTQQNNAIATFWLDFVITAKITDFIGSSERLRLRRDNNDWLIVPVQDGKAPFWESPPRPMMEDVMDMFIAKMRDGGAILSESQFSQCQSQLKQLGLGAMQYAQDFDEVFPSHEEWQKDIMPYIRNADLLHCPKDAENPNSYSFNTDMGNFALAQVKAPTQTILIYEGKDRKFDFRHQVGEEKLTNILFVDGHLKAFSEKALEAALKDQTVRWKPQ
jgi:prepilin-type processing-associated H-X9-DG protein